VVLILLILLARLIYNEQPRSFWSGKGILTLAALGWYLWLCISFFANRLKEFKLLTEGSFAGGVVLVQQDLSRSLPRITYVFRDSMGRPFQKRVTDFSHALFEQMPVSIFYDESEPSHSTSLESSLFRVD
jgi:hypothetical protein